MTYRSSILPGAVVMLALAPLSLACKRKSGGASSGDPAPVTYAPTALTQLGHGQRVAVDVVLLPEEVFKTSSTGQLERVYMLAVARDDAYLARFTPVIEEIDKLLRDAEAAVAAPRPKKSKHNPRPELNKRLQEVIDQMSAIEPDAKTAVLVELDGFAAMKVRTAWSTVIEECHGLGPDCLPSRVNLNKLLGGLPTMQGWLPGCTDVNDVTCLDRAVKQLGEMEKVAPPDLERPMPRLPNVHSPFGAEPRLVRKYNALVPRYNREIERREIAQLAALPGTVARVRRLTLARRGVEWTVRGTVRPVAELAARTIRESGDGSGPTPAMEIGEAGANSFSRSFYKSTRVCVSANVTASFVVAGQTLAPDTPCTDVAVGTKLTLEAHANGLEPGKLDWEVADAPVLGVTEIGCSLHQQASTCRAL